MAFNSPGHLPEDSNVIAKSRVAEPGGGGAPAALGGGGKGSRSAKACEVGWTAMMERGNPFCECGGGGEMGQVSGASERGESQEEREDEGSVRIAG